MTLSFTLAKYRKSRFQEHTAGMPTWETSECIIHQCCVGVLADICVDEDPVWVESSAVVCPYEIVLKILSVWLAASKQIRSWFPKQILHSLSEEKGKRKRKGETHPAG